MSGKGDTPRPYSVSSDVFSENYCRAFGHKVRNDRCINCGAKPEGSLKDDDNGKAANLPDARGI